MTSVTVISRRCQIGGCDKPVEARRLCSQHYKRWQRHGDPRMVLPLNTFKPGALHPNWAGTEPGYRAAHFRLRRTRGPASQHPCIHCGEPAREWSYDHQDPNELIDVVETHPNVWAILAYSVDFSHYQSRCNRCHQLLDKATG